MATVNILLPAFGITWAQDGSVSAIDEAQWRAGWAYIGATPPTVEQFNKVFQIQDQKANYLYAQMKAVFDVAGRVPAANDLNSLRDSLATFGKNMAGFVSSTAWIAPAGVTRIRARVWGAGGGGGGTSNGAAAGGAGGGYAEGFFAVTPGTSYAVTVGTGGAAGSGAPTAGGNGGTSSVGALLGATGGAGGGGASGGGATGFTSTVGEGYGGQLNLKGSVSNSGIVVGGQPLGSAGGGSFGTSVVGGFSNGGGNQAGYPGGGGGGAGGTTFASGNAGANGLVVIEW